MLIIQSVQTTLGIQFKPISPRLKPGWLAGTYQIGGTAYGNHTPITVTHTILPMHYIRPIPQGQLDGMEATAAEKTAYQSPGYQ